MLGKSPLAVIPLGASYSLESGSYEFGLDSTISLSGDLLLDLSLDFICSATINLTASLQFIDQSVIIEKLKCSSIIIHQSIYRKAEDDLEAATVSNTRVQSVCCYRDLPLKIALKHDLWKSSALKYFLKRNNFNTPSYSVLSYDKVSQLWNGYDRFSNQNEMWYLYYSWSCDFENFVPQSWIFKIHIKSSLDNTTTTLIAKFSSQVICKNSLILSFTFDYHVKTNSFNPLSSYFILRDPLGLFANNASVLRFTLAEYPLPDKVLTFDISDPVNRATHFTQNETKLTFANV